MDGDKTIVVPAKAGTHNHQRLWLNESLPQLPVLDSTGTAYGSPLSRRAVRGKSAIAELQLVGGDSLLAFAGVDGWRFGNGGDRSPREQELTDELREPERKHGGAVHSCRDAQ